MFNEQMEIALAEFWHVGWVLVLLIAGISVLTGFVREYIPQEKLQKKLKNQNTVVGALMGAGLGVLTPFCSASMVPVAMGMIEMSAPFSTVLPFLLSAPLANFVVVAIILGTFGWKVALIYFLWTFSCAILAGLTIGRSKVRNYVKNLAEIAEEKKKKAAACCAPVATSCCGTPATNCCEVIEESTTACCAPAPSIGGHNEKVRGAFQFALALFRQIIPYVLIGAAISGITAAFIPNDIVEKYVGNDAWYAIPLAAAIGVPLYLRIEMAIPLLSVLLVKGMSMGAAMALLIGGTGASLPEIAILSAMLKPKGLIAFVLTVFVIATLGGVLFMFV
ncbi:permease [Sporomusa sphaeroides]|uniref:permease n=1 Tax=Sporomusa sphaeroides TaxID=47679 RepID=UPI002C555094|nr:permease [Sporomusa sphaeroides]HML31987.1 permease [Sporomusa sphaeroides]